MLFIFFLHKRFLTIATAINGRHSAPKAISSIPGPSCGHKLEKNIDILSKRLALGFTLISRVSEKD